MKKIFTFLFLFIGCTSVIAQNLCPSPEQKAVVFFGNGISVDPKGASTSLAILQRALGSTYNGQKLRYDLAYNKTSGIALDLGQSVMQAGAQWDSQIMGWLNGLGIAPDWFTTWYNTYVLAVANVVASEVSEHVEKYRTALLFGQKVLVVAHSQGNFYVNEAKKLLEMTMTPEQMKSFGIFGVAVPSNNVGGASGPYYTNHRDIILNVPTALPYNWALHRSNGSLAEDLPQLNAHYFNDTYMSNDFDIRPALLIGIKGQLAALSTPPPECTATYQRHFVNLFAGTYACFKASDPGTQIGTSVVSTNGNVAVLERMLVASLPSVAVQILRQIEDQGNGPAETRLIATKYIDLRHSSASASGVWSETNQFSSLLVNDNTDDPLATSACFPALPGRGEL